MSPIKANATTAVQVRDLLIRTGKVKPAKPITPGCEKVQVYGADLAKSNADVIVGASLCDGDIVSEWHIIRGGKVVETGWASLDAGMGNVRRLEQLFKRYGNQRPAIFDYKKSGTSWKLVPSS